MSHISRTIASLPISAGAGTQGSDTIPITRDIRIPAGSQKITVEIKNDLILIDGEVKGTAPRVGNAFNIVDTGTYTRYPITRSAENSLEAGAKVKPFKLKNTPASLVLDLSGRGTSCKE